MYQWKRATITLSLSAKDTTISIDEIIKALRNIEHVSKVELISMDVRKVTNVLILENKLTQLFPTHVVVESINGVGYEIQTPNSIDFKNIWRKN